MREYIGIFTNCVIIDRHEKNDRGDNYMVDVLGRKWYKERGFETGRYAYYPNKKDPEAKVIYSRKQNKKVIRFNTYGATGDIEIAYQTEGKTLSFKRAYRWFVFRRNKAIQIHNDSVFAIVEFLLSGE